MASSPLALLPLLTSVCASPTATPADPSLPGGSTHTGGHQRLWQDSEGWQVPACPCMCSSHLYLYTPSACR